MQLNKEPLLKNGWSHNQEPTEDEKQREVDIFFAQESARRANWKRTWFCLKCYKDMGDNQYCPNCGAHRLGDMAISKKEALEELRKFSGRKSEKRKSPMFSEEECFAFGIHPDDEMYRKTIELNILSKDYRK